MARNYTNILTAIWRDPEFIALPASTQRTYLMLVTQAEISSCGVLSITLRRWSGYAPDSTPDGLTDDLFRLSVRAFVVIDWDAEELLVRSFVRHDGGFNNDRRRPAIKAAASAIVSTLLRQVTAHELNRLNVPHDLSDSPLDALSDALPDTPRVVVTNVTTTPQPTTQKPQPTTSNRPAKPDALADPWLFSEFWNHYPRKVRKDAARRAWNSAVKRASPDDIVAGADRMARDPNLPNEQFIPHPATWLTQGGWEDAPYPEPEVRTTRRESTSDRIVSDGMSLAAKFAAEEAATRPQLGA